MFEPWIAVAEAADQIGRFAARKDAFAITRRAAAVPEAIHHRDSNGRTPLFAAVQGGRNCVKVILQERAEPDVVDVLGVSPLHLAAQESRNFRNAVEVLL